MIPALNGPTIRRRNDSAGQRQSRTGYLDHHHVSLATLHSAPGRRWWDPSGTRKPRERRRGGGSEMAWGRRVEWRPLPESEGDSQNHFLQTGCGMKEDNLEPGGSTPATPDGQVGICHLLKGSTATSRNHGTNRPPASETERRFTGDSRPEGPSPTDSLDMAEGTPD